MSRETITLRQAACILIVFIFGSTIIMGAGNKAEQDTWLSLLLAAIGAIPLVLVYARIMRLFPEKGVFEITEALFGKVVGKIFTALLCWYAVHLCSLVIRDFSEFIVLTSMPETPQLPIMILIALVAVYIVKSGVESLGKWALAVFPVICFVVFITILMSLRDIDFTNLQPMFNHDMGTIASASVSTISFPFAETVLFLSIAGAIKRTDSPKKLYISSVLISGGILILVVIRNIGMLGVPLWKAEYFPSYSAVRIIHVADYLMRTEGSIAMNFVFTGITKITVCLFAASKGLASLFGIKDYKQMAMPAGLLSLALCVTLYKSIMEMYGFLKVYQYYAAPFQILIPLIIWITAEIKIKRGKLF